MPYGKGALEKGLDILHLLGSERPLDVQGIADRLAIPKSSVYRLVQVLRARGMVEQVPDGHEFRLGTVVLDWAERLKSSFDLVRLVHPHLEQIVAETRETAQLTVARGDMAVTIDVVEFPAPVRVAPVVGRALPLYCGAAAKAILAFRPEEQWPRKGLQRLGPGGFSSVAKLRAELQATRARGHALSTEEVYEGAAACAIPLFDIQHKPIASLAVSGPIHRFSADRARHALKVLKRAAIEFQDSARVTADPSRGKRVPSKGETS
jgi:DNA-binding IclR family transcriptional regulator